MNRSSGSRFPCAKSNARHSCKNCQEDVTVAHVLTTIAQCGTKDIKQRKAAIGYREKYEHQIGGKGEFIPFAKLRNLDPYSQFAPPSAFQQNRRAMPGWASRPMKSYPISAKRLPPAISLRAGRA